MQKKKLTPLQIVGHVLHTAILGVLAVVMAVLLFAANVILPGYARMVNAMLGYKKSWDNSKVQTDGLNLDYNTSDYTADNIGAAEADLTDRINSEGVVLLKNDGGLPLAEGTTVSLFSANSNQNAGAGLMGGGTPLNTALASHGLNVNETLWNFYSAGAGAGYGLASGSISFGDAEDFRINECPLSVLQGESGLLDSVQGTTPVYVLKRVAGEGRDMPRSMYNHADTQEDKVRSYLEPDTTEREILQYLNDNYDNTVLIINSNAALELDWLADYPNIKSVLYAPTIGASMADILTGKVSPSGRTVDTFAADASASPAAQNFGDYAYYDENGNITKYNYVTYEEGIYVGYRYYETRYEDTVLGQGNAGDYDYAKEVIYPFGYGLSYTSFDWKVTDASANGATLTKDGDVTVKVTVTNTGDRAGKDVVQLYYTAPYIAGEIEKSSVELGAFAKTKELQPGESEEVTLTVPVSDMASYDAYDANHNGFTGYELDAGDYIFTVRHDAHDVDDDAAATITCNLPANVQYAEDTVTGNPVSNKFTGSDAIDGVSLDGSDSEQNIAYMTRADFASTFPKTNTPSRAMTDNVKALNLYTADMADGYINEADEAITTGAKNGLKIEDNGKTTDLGFQLGADFNDPQWDALLDELTVNEMENMYINAYGGLAELKSVGKTKSKDADGPSQIGGFTGMGAGTGFPSSSTLAQTWNGELAQEEGRTIGTQALQNGYTGWYAPATNMHRGPFNGRNYEYYSEDSLLSGVICGNTVHGANDAGVYTYVKHFICNDGESGIYRDSVYTWMTEQALREIYLRPFQMLVEDYDAVGLMSSYNRIGAVWAGGSEALLTGILRDEWGFDGAVITDYCDHHSYMNGDQALRAGGSLWMAGFTGGEMAFETGSNSYLQALRRAAKQTLYMYLHVRVTNRDYAESIGDTAALRHDFKPAVLGWRHLVALIDLVAVALFALAIRGIVRDVKLYKAAKAARAENKNA